MINRSVFGLFVGDKSVMVCEGSVAKPRSVNSKFACSILLSIAWARGPGPRGRADVGKCSFLEPRARHCSWNDFMSGPAREPSNAVSPKFGIAPMYVTRRMRRRAPRNIIARSPRVTFRLSQSHGLHQPYDLGANHAKQLKGNITLIVAGPAASLTEASTAPYRLVSSTHTPREQKDERKHPCVPEAQTGFEPGSYPMSSVLNATHNLRGRRIAPEAASNGCNHGDLGRNGRSYLTHIWRAGRPPAVARH
nr:hypothetical protein CFP56_67384 [Quercus suber]